jgi:LacI family transcriptional regulator
MSHNKIGFKMRQKKDVSKITIDVVAQKSGFSRATVSRVLNRDASVKPATAQKILQVIEELGYTPHSIASALSGGKTKTLAILLPDLVHEYYTQLLAGADSTAEEHGYILLLKTRNTKKVFQELVEGNRVDAFILRYAGPTSFDEDLLKYLRNRQIPYVVIGTPPFLDTHPAVMIDNIGGARLMAHHYAAHGFRRILFVTGPEYSNDSKDRLYGFKVGLSEKGIDPAGVVVCEGDFSQQSGYEVAKQYLLQERFDGVFAANDSMALGVIQFCQDRGIRVPEDLAVTGFDDNFFAAHLQPPLTTIRQPMFEIGVVAVLNLLRTMEKGEQLEPRVILPTKLIIRRSCGCTIEKNTLADGERVQTNGLR